MCKRPVIGSADAPGGTGAEVAHTKAGNLGQRRTRGTSPGVRAQEGDRCDRPAAAWPPEYGHFLRQIIGEVPVVVFALDSDGRFTLSEGGALRQLGLEPGEVVGQSVFNVLADVADLDRFVHRLLSKGPGTTLLTVRDKVFEVWHAPLRDPGGDAAGVAGMAIDVTGRHRAEEQRRAEQAVTKRMLHMQERDRQLTAYEIHDGLVQDITAAQMRLAGLLSGDQSLAKPLADQIAAAEELVSRAVREARRLISGLRPPALDEQGIVAAIERLVADQPPGGPKVRFAARLEPGRLDRLLEVSVYRIVQEAVNNARRHSGSDRIEIRLEQADERILIHVEDWGAGFDPARVAENRFGLQGIRQRARLLGGRADIDSGPGRGTRIDVELPVTHALDDVVNRDS